MSLSDLPTELIVQIGSYLEVPDLANLSGVNKRISSIIDKSNILWKHSLEYFGLNCDPYIERMIRGNFDKLVLIIFFTRTEMGPMVHGIPALVTWVMGGPWALAAPVIVLDPFYRIIRVRLSVPDSSNCTVQGSFIKYS
jgi:hypothetical protein